MSHADSHWSYATSIKSRVIVTLSPVMLLYILERSPPSAGLKGVWSAFAIGDAKLPSTSAAMVSGGEKTFGERSNLKLQTTMDWTFLFKFQRMWRKGTSQKPASLAMELETVNYTPLATL